MNEVPNETVDSIITSPPYFNIKDYSKDGYQKKELAGKNTNKLVTQSIMRVLSKNC